MRRIMILALLSLTLVLVLAGKALAIDIPPNHPQRGDCYSCHIEGKFDAFICADCHGTKAAVPNLTSFSSPNPPVIHNDSPVQPTIHSNYSQNTDACASCHDTHTAVGSALLQWTDTATACMACHDGTVSTTYDVRNGVIGTTSIKTSGGLFGLGGEAGFSNHNVTAELATAAAPGGSENKVLKDSNGDWTIKFNCIACHTPHGQGGNSRILNSDPNGIALANRVVNGALTPAVPGTTYAAPVGQRDWIAGYPYSQYTKVYVNGVLKNSGYSIDYRQGTVTFNPALQLTDVVTADYVPGVRVVLNVSDKLTTVETVGYVSGMNEFCAACHTDYDTSTEGVFAGQTLTGYYRKAYRHGVGMTWNDQAHGTQVVQAGVLKFEEPTATTGRITCLTCHFAHGTNDTFIGNGQTYDDTRSTALKRQVNMALCETCHQKGRLGNY